MSRVLLHQFSPQRTDPEFLETILVGREEVLNRTVAKVRDSAMTANKHHALFVGPRGIGKTHLLSLIHHRVHRDPELTSRLRIAWLNEDEISSSFLRLLVRIYRELSSRYPGEFPLADIQAVTGLDPTDALNQLTTSFLQRVGDHTVVILIENLDAHFAKIPLAELRRWRAFVQDHPVFVTLGTAQRLFDGVSKQDEPFFGFFDTRHLKPLTLEQTQQMLIHVAELNGGEDDRAFIRFLKTDRGQARLKAIHFLAGGNPRLYVLLSELITRDELEDVVRTFEEMVDRQLTSYYQERLRWLSTQQQEIVQVLCRRRHPVSVKEIAADLFTTNQSISSQLRELRNFDYVRSHQVGRESRYELAEPLMRLVLEVKESQVRQPLTLIVDFLRVWFDREELNRRLGQPSCGGLGAAYIQAAIQHYDRGQDLRHDLLEFQQLTVMEAGDPRDVSDASVAESDDRMSRAYSLAISGDLDAAIELWTGVIDDHDAPVAQVAKALFNRGVTYGRRGETDAETSDYTGVIELPDAPVEQVAKSLFNRGVTYGQLGDTDVEISDYTHVIELPDVPVDQVTKALFNRGITYGQLGDTDAEISDYTHVIELPNVPVEEVADALFRRGFAYGQRGDTDAAISDYTYLIELPDAPVDAVAKVLFNRGVTYLRRDEMDAAISDFTHVVELPGAPVDQVTKALGNRGYVFSLIGDLESALADYERAEQLDVSDGVSRSILSVNKADLYARIGRVDEAVSLVTDLLGMPCDELSYVIRATSSDFWLGLARVAFATGPSRWQAIIAAMVEKAVETKSLPELGEALVRHLKDIDGSKSEQHALTAWKSEFSAAGSRHESLMIPLRLVGVGIDYIVSKNEEALLALPLEERRILRQALDLDEERAPL